MGKPVRRQIIFSNLNIGWSSHRPVILYREGSGGLPSLARRDLDAPNGGFKDVAQRKEKGRGARSKKETGAKGEAQFICHEKTDEYKQALKQAVQRTTHFLKKL